MICQKVTKSSISLQLKSIYLSPQKINDQNGEQKQADVTFRFLVT